MIFFGEESLRKAIQNFVSHYHSERNHQGLKTNSSGQKPATSEARERSSAGSDWAAC
jgi:hypothetical protein